LNNSRSLGASEQLWLKLGQEDSNNFVVVAQLAGEVDREQLLSALQEITRAQATLCVKVKKNSFHLEEVPQVTPTIIPREDHEHWQRLVEHELNSAIPINAFPLWRFNWLKGEGHHEFVLTFNHGIADGRSGVVFFEYLLKRMADSSFKIPLTPLRPSFEKLFMKPALWGLAQSAWAYLWDKRTSWQRMTANRELSVKETGLLSRNLNAGQVTKVVDLCRQHKTSVSAYLAALLSHFEGDTHDKNVRLSLAVDVRPFLKENSFADIAYNVATVDLAKRAGNTDNIWDLSRSFKTTITKKCRQQFKFDQLIVASALKLKKEHKGFMKLIRSANTNSIMLTNLGRLNIPANYNNLKLLRCFHIPSVHLLGLPYVALATTTLQGEMVLNFTYTKAYFSAKTIESMVDNFMANLMN
jgi:NRPS condensation-like uncharacterized protein